MNESGGTGLDQSSIGQSQMSGAMESGMAGMSSANLDSSMMASNMNQSQMMSQGGNSMFVSGMVSGMGIQQQAGLNSALPPYLTETMRVLERMVMQNIYAVNHLQYSGFDLPSELKSALAENAKDDEEESEEESEDDEEWSDDDEISYRLDSQWQYECEATKDCNVSGLSWSKKPKYEHVLAVSYGETDFENALKPGAILIWSLKNPKHPDHMIATHSGVMCIAFSHTHHNLLAAGMYDGTVCIYDIGRRDIKPMMECNYTQKHTGPVWELRWVDQNSERVQIEVDDQHGRGYTTGGVFAHVERRGYVAHSVFERSAEHAGVATEDLDAPPRREHERNRAAQVSCREGGGRGRTAPAGGYEN